VRFLVLGGGVVEPLAGTGHIVISGDIRSEPRYTLPTGPLRAAFTGSGSGLSTSRDMGRVNSAAALERLIRYYKYYRYYK